MAFLPDIGNVAAYRRIHWSHKRCTQWRSG
jgi:hypothetical protein